MRTHRNHRTACGSIAALQDFDPGLAAVCCLVDAALVAIAPQLSWRTGVNDVAVFRIDQDFRDALGIAQAHVVPVLAPVGRLIDAIAYANTVPRPGFTGTDPNGFRCLRIDGDGADRLHRLLVENGLIGSAAIHGLPDAAARCADIHGQPAIFLDCGYCRDASAHCG